MSLGRGQVSKAIENLIDTHAELVISGDADYGISRSRDNWPSPGDAWIRNDIGIIKFRAARDMFTLSLLNRSCIHKTENITQEQIY